MAPEDVGYDARGTLYVSDFTGNVVMAVAEDGTMSPVAGVGVTGTSGDGGPAVEAESTPRAGWPGIRKGASSSRTTTTGVSGGFETDGTITTIAGSCGHVGFAGDGVPATAARFNDPIGLAFDRRGGLLIADEQNARVRRMDPDGTIDTIAGGGDRPPKDGLRATEVALSHPSYVVVGPDDRIVLLGLPRRDRLGDRTGRDAHRRRG